MTPRIGSLFSGAGGLDMAVESVFGAEVAWHCELDSAASKVLAARWPGVPNLGDITAVDWFPVESVDIICGGWPCQPFSVAGKRKGADDERALWPYVARAIRLVRPRLVVLENVSAVLGPEFQRVANDLATLRYDIAWTCLRAGDVGAPHRRDRLFVLATDTARDGWHERWPESARLVGGSDAAVGGDGPVDLLPTPCARDFKDATASPGAVARNTPSLGAIEHYLPTPASVDGHRGPDFARAGRDGSGGNDLVTAVTLLPTPNAADGNGGGRYSSAGHQTTLPGEAREIAVNWGKYEAAIRRWESLTRPAPAPTEPNTKGNPRLSAAFSEWMMGWPAGWVTDVEGISRNDALRIVGNGVCPQQAHAAIRWLLSVCEVAA